MIIRMIKLIVMRMRLSTTIMVMMTIVIILTIVVRILFAHLTPVTSARESHAHPHVHPSLSSRDLVARRLMTRSGVYFARLCTPARIGSKIERKRRGADMKKGTHE